MRHTKLEDSEVFNIFADIAEKEGLLKKKASYIYPNYDISEKNAELTLDAVVASEHGQLYGVTPEKGEDLVNQAHPGGGTTPDVPASQDYGKVETIVEQQKTNRDIAERTPSGKMAALVQKLAGLAEHLDENGFVELANHVDSELEKLANDFIGLPPGAMPGKPAVPQRMQTPQKGPPTAPGQQPSKPENVWDLTPEAEQMYNELAEQEEKRRQQVRQQAMKYMGPAFQQVDQTLGLKS